MRGRKELLDRLPIGKGAEIGVWEGDFSEKLSQKATELHLIDPWLHQDFKGRKYFKKTQKEMDEIFEGVVKRFPNAMIHRDFSHKVLPAFPDKYFDWIYIDGNHVHEWVKADIELSLKKAKMVCGDDYSWVEQALRPYPIETISSQWIIL